MHSRLSQKAGTLKVLACVWEAPKHLKGCQASYPGKEIPACSMRRARSTGRRSGIQHVAGAGKCNPHRTPEHTHREWGGSAAISFATLDRNTVKTTRLTPLGKSSRPIFAANLDQVEWPPHTKKSSIVQSSIILGSSSDHDWCCRGASQFFSRFAKQIASWRFTQRTDVRIIAVLFILVSCLAVCGLVWSFCMLMLGQLTHGRRGSAAGLWTPVSVHFGPGGTGYSSLPACCEVRASSSCILCQSLPQRAADAACPDGFVMRSKLCTLDPASPQVATEADSLGRQAQYILRYVTSNAAGRPRMQ